MKNKFLIFSILFNILLMIVLFVYYNNVINNKELDIINDNENKKINICEDIIMGKNTSHYLSSIYKNYKNIEDNKIASYDYNIQDKIFIKKDCEFFKNKEKYDYDICKDIKDKNINKIEKLRIPKGDKLMILSYLTGEDKCGSNEECIFYRNFEKKLELKKIEFPLNISTTRDVEFYAYKKLHPNDYNEKLDKLFLLECNKILK